MAKKRTYYCGTNTERAGGAHLSLSHGYYRSGNGWGELFFKVRQESENFTLSKGKFKSLKKSRKIEILRVHIYFINSWTLHVTC